MAVNGTLPPISVPPSQQWDGNDGPWSSFSIHVGTPPQPARVLVSTTVGETWVISANTTQGGCLTGDPSNCAQSRGGLVNVNTSSTWQDQGIYALGDEVNLDDYTGDYVNGDYGLETLGLGLPGGNGVTLNNIVVAALATKDFYVGNLGVNQQPTNFSTFTNTHTSFLKSLKDQNHISSLSYGYTAGNQYRLKKVFGSLTLGGYDASKFTPTDNSFQFAGDISRDLVVGLQSITYMDSSSNQKQLLSQGILTFVDATVPHIWLPEDSCTAFEQAFGLEYNTTLNRYFVNDTLHSSLQSSNPSVSFILGNQVNGGQTVNVTLPYAAFDLTLGYPFVNQSTRYFPLRRAANVTQYTLGRTFLQESYLIVDYERSNFSIFPAVFSDTAPTNLVAIPSVNQTTLPPNLTKTQQPASKSISAGAIAGIVVAIVLIVALAAMGALFFIRRRRKMKAAASKEDEYDPMAKPEMDGEGKTIPGELLGSEGKLDKSDSLEGFEMEGSKGKDNKLRAEMEGSKGGAEMEGGQHGRLYAEMEGEAQAPVELWAGDYGLYDELASPVAVNVSSGTPSPGLRSSDSAPSPISARSERGSGNASFTRRQKPTPRLPGEESTDEVSSQDEFGAHRSSGQGRTSSAHPSRLTPLSRTPQEEGVNSPTESTRERHRRGANALTRRLESTASRNTSSISSRSHEGERSWHGGGSQLAVSRYSSRSGGVSGSEDAFGPSDRETSPRNWRRPAADLLTTRGINTPSESSPIVSPTSEHAESPGRFGHHGNFF